MLRLQPWPLSRAELQRTLSPWPPAGCRQQLRSPAALPEVLPKAAVAMGGKSCCCSGGRARCRSRSRSNAAAFRFIVHPPNTPRKLSALSRQRVQGGIYLGAVLAENLRRRCRLHFPDFYSSSGHGRGVRCSSARLSGHGCSRSNAPFRFTKDTRINPRKNLTARRRGKKINQEGIKNADGRTLRCSSRAARDCYGYTAGCQSEVGSWLST